MKRYHRSGMTLMELIVGLAVLAVISTLGIGVLIQAMEQWQLSRIYATLNLQADTVLDNMRQDFNHMLPASLSGVAISGGEQRRDDVSRTGSSQIDSFLVLPVRVPQEKGLPLSANAMYHVVAEEKGPATLRRTLGPLGSNPPAGATQPLLNGVSLLALRTEFQDAQGQWLSEWKAPVSPEAVRVSMTLCDANRPNEQIARKAVFALRVK